MTTTNYIKYLITFILCLFSSFSYAQWHDTGTLSAWPASNHTYYAGTMGASHMVSSVIITGSTAVTVGSTDWHFLTKTTNVMRQGAIQLLQPINGVWWALYEQTNTWVKVALPPGTTDNFCDVAILITNTVIGETNSFYTAAARTNLLAFPTPPVNQYRTIDCALTNVPQLAGVDYTPLNVSGNVYDYDGQSNVYYEVLSCLTAATDKNLNVDEVWVYDAKLAVDERENAMSFVIPSTFQRLAADVHMATDLSLPEWKAWILAYAPRFAVKEYADTDGTFTTWCNRIVTNWSWQTYGGNGYWLEYPGIGTNKMHVINTLDDSEFDWVDHWTRNIPAPGQSSSTIFSHLPPPAWPPPSTNTTVWTWPVIAPDLRQSLTDILHLPGAYLTNAVTITDVSDAAPGWLAADDTTPEAWEAGGIILTNYTIAFTSTTTPIIFYGSYLDYTPKLHYRSPATGLGHIVTNRWLLKNIWLPWKDGSSLDAVITNPLVIAGNTFLNLTSPAIIQSSNSAYYTTQILSFSNWVTTEVSDGVTSLVGHTNTTSVALKAVLDRFDTNAANAEVDFSVLNVPASSLLSKTLTNLVNSNTIVVVTKNWNIAEGRHEIDYDWDGVRTCLNSFTWLLANTAFYGWTLPDASQSRYETNSYPDICDTNLVGLISGTVRTNLTVSPTDVLSGTPFKLDTGGVGLSAYSATRNGAAEYYKTGPFSDLHYGFENIENTVLVDVYKSKIVGLSNGVAFSSNTSSNTLMFVHGQAAPATVNDTQSLSGIVWSAKITFSFDKTIATKDVGFFGFGNGSFDLFTTDITGLPAIDDVYSRHSSRVEATQGSVPGFDVNVCRDYDSARDVYAAGYSSVLPDTLLPITYLPVDMQFDFVTWLNANYPEFRNQWIKGWSESGNTYPYWLYFNSVCPFVKYVDNGNIPLIWAEISVAFGGNVGQEIPLEAVVQPNTIRQWTPPPSIPDTLWDDDQKIPRWGLVFTESPNANNLLIDTATFLNGTAVQPVIVPPSYDGILRDFGVRSPVEILKYDQTPDGFKFK